jgi:hypothetical protein
MTSSTRPGNRPGSAGPQLGIQRISQRVAEQIEAEHGKADGETREDRHPRRAFGIFLRTPAQHEAPSGRRLLHAQAKVRQGRLDQDRLTDGCRHDDEIGRHHVGDHMAQDDPGVTEAARARGIDIGNLANGKSARSHHARGTGNEWDGDGNDDVQCTGPKDRHHGQRQDDQREGHEHIHHTLKNKIHLAAEVGTTYPQHQAGRRADKRGRKAYQECRSRPVDDARIDIAPELIRAEPVSGTWRLVHDAEIVGGGLIDGDPIGEHSHDDHHDDDQPAGNAERVVPCEMPQHREPRTGRRVFSVGDYGVGYGHHRHTHQRL